MGGGSILGDCSREVQIKFFCDGLSGIVGESQNLKKYRKQKGWSQFELAEKAGISDQTINSMEGLRLWPSDKTLAKISGALGVEMYKLFVPPTLTFQSESIAELKHAVVKTVEELVHDTLRDWETQ